MVSTIAESWRYRVPRLLASHILRVLPMTAHILRVLPIPKEQKFIIGGFIEKNLRSVASPRKVVQMVEGFKMDLDLSDSIELQMYYSRLYGPAVTSLFKHLLMPGDTVIDGGANIGYFSLLAAKYVGEHGRVYSFEPVPQTFETLNKNVHLNTFTNICTNRLALTQSAGELRLEIPTDTYTGNPLGRLATTALLGRGSQAVVSAVTLDEYANCSGITSIKLVKLDIEGGEVAAIAGMRQLLSKHRISYLICESCTIFLDQMGIPYSAMQEALSEYNYSCYLIKRPKRAWIGVEPVDLVAISLKDTLAGQLPPNRSLLPDGSAIDDYLFAAPGMAIPRDMTT